MARFRLKIQEQQVVTHQPAISFSISFLSPFNRAGGRTFNVGLGRGHEDAFESEADQAAGEDEPGGTCFVADLEGGEFDIEFFGEFAQGSFGGEDAAAAGSVIDRVLAGSPGGVGDCFLVDIESDVVGFGHGVFRYDINVG